MLALPAAAHADWAYTRWGMSPEEAVRASRGTLRILAPEERRQVQRAGMEYRVAGTHREGTLRLRVALAFDTQGLACVNYTLIDARLNAALRDWLVARHGSPRAEDQAGPGAADLSWRGADVIDASFDPGEPGAVLHCRR